MAEDIEVSNLVTKISVDDSDLAQKMAGLSRQMKMVQSEFETASSKLGKYAEKQDVLELKSESLTKQLDIQRVRVAKLNDEHQKLVESKGADAVETQKLALKLNKATTEYNKLYHELKDTNQLILEQRHAWREAATEIDKAAQKMNEIDAAVGKMKSLDSVAQKMNSFGQNMTDAGQSLSMMLTVPIAGAGAAATKASIDFETAFAGVEKTINATQKEFEQFETEIREMSKTMPATATEIAQVAEAAGQLGIKNDAIMGFTKTMTELGTATNMSATEAATALARLANITGMPQSDFDRLGSTIVALGNSLATTESEITEMSLRLAGAGKQVGMTEAQILALAGSLSSVGIEAEAGGSSFSRVMIDMASAVQTNNEHLQTFASVANMSSQQFKEAFQQDAGGALISFIEGLDRISKAGGNTFGVLEKLQLSEIQVRDALLRASGAGDLFRNSLELGTKAWQENSALTDEASKRYETTASQLQMLGNRINDAAITLGDALVPAIMAVLDNMEPLFETIEEGAEWFANLDSSSQKIILTVTAVAAAAGPLLIVIGQMTTGISALIPVVKGLGTALTFLTSNPIGLTISALALAGSAFLSIKNNMAEAKQAAEELAEAQQALQEVQENGIERSEVQATQEKIDKLNELIDTYQKLVDTAASSDAASLGNNVGALDYAADELGVTLKEVEDIANEFGVSLEYIDENGQITAKSMGALQNAVNIYSKVIKDANKETTAELSDQAKQIATRKQEVSSLEALIKTYTTAKKGSQAWSSAQKQLLAQFPQFATSTGINVKAIEGLNQVKQREVELEWASIQAKAQEALQEKNTAIAKQEAAIKVAESIARITGESGLAQAALARMNDELTRLRGEAASLEALATLDPEKMVPTTPVTPINISGSSGGSTGGGSSKAYENKALDNAYKQMDHLKALDKLTLEQELKMLEKIQQKYIKTADERMAIEEKIYSIKKQLGDNALQNSLDNYERAKELGKLTENDEIVLLKRIRKLYADSAEERKDIDDKIFEATQRKIEAEKQLREEVVNYTSQQLQAAYEDRLAREQLSDEEAFKLKDKLYNEQIYLNKNYLNKVLEDDRYTVAEKRSIEREITETIRTQTNERLELQRDYAESVRQTQIEDINKLSEGIQDALKEKYQAEKKAAEDAIKAQQEANNQWKENQLEAIKSVYDARVKAAQDAANQEIEHINSVYNAQINAIQKQLDALEEVEKQKSRADLDAEDQKKIERLEGLIEYEHDDFNKKELQDELNKAIAERDERHRVEQLEDKKEALAAEQEQLKEKMTEETEAIREQLEVKKEFMAEEYEAQQANINAIYAAQKASLDQRLTDTQAHYNQLLAAKALQAEAEKMIISQQQADIIALLESYGEGYNVAGQTLGEQMYQGFKGQVDQIQTLIDNIHAQIASARAAAMSAMSSAASSVVNNNNSRSVSQVNNFYSSTTSPSQVVKAAKKVAQGLLGF